LRTILKAGLQATEAMWPEVRTAFRWVRRFATVLGNSRGWKASEVRRHYQGLVAALARHRKTLGGMATALDHFRKVTRSYWRGLFPCYEIADLPRTNNDLEQFFGSYRYHERRASGRRTACPGTVIRGSVRLIAAAATRARLVEVRDLVPAKLEAWRELRRTLEQRRNQRILGRRFRKDPQGYLEQLENALINKALPA
jgi:hypothetical protein